MKRRFHIVDVFSNQIFAGNPLAVIEDASGLTSHQMQMIAKEFAFSETAFFMPSTSAKNHAQLRIFTPTTELPFAGHPNIGAAFVAGHMGQLFGKPVQDQFTFEQGAGLVDLQLITENKRIIGANCRAPQPFLRGADVAPAIIAELIGLNEFEILLGRFMPCIGGTGTNFLFAEITHAALEDAKPNLAAFERHHQELVGWNAFFGLHLHARDSNDPSRLDCRMFAPTSGVAEDPATGSAASALAGLLHSLRPDHQQFTLFQGRHLDRPSEISATVTDNGIWIGGQCATFATGEIDA